MNRIAQRFLARCFQPEETIALLLRRENPRSDSTARRALGDGSRTSLPGMARL